MTSENVHPTLPGWLLLPVKQRIWVLGKGAVFRDTASGQLS